VDNLSAKRYLCGFDPKAKFKAAQRAGTGQVELLTRRAEREDSGARVKAGKNYLILVCALLTVAGGAAAWTQHHENAELRADVQRRLVETANALNNIQSQIAALQQEVSTLSVRRSNQGNGDNSGPDDNAGGIQRSRRRQRNNQSNNN
jgi:hypothetical protein